MSVAGMLNEARKSIGTREFPLGSNQNYITRWYGLTGPWCDMSITYWAYHSGNQKSVCPAGKRAYTVWHAQDFQRAGRWYAGTAANVSQARAGDIVFFDWTTTNSVGLIDHVGIVERNLGGGRLQTIEGNTSDVCARRVRESSTIAGYGRPAYGAAAPAVPGVVRVPVGTPVLSSGDTGDRVRNLQGALNYLGGRLNVDGQFGPATKARLQEFQRNHALTPDGVYGPLSASALRKAVTAKQNA